MRIFEILDKRQLSPGVYMCRIQAPDIARRRKAGQFVVLRLGERGERVPLTIVDSDMDEGSITVIFQRVGKTTAMLGDMGRGDSILDVAGPLGMPTRMENFGAAICIGGGVGVATLYQIARALKEAGNTVVSIIGARTRDLLILEDEMRSVSHELIVATDDGSRGHHGFVTQMLQKRIDDEKKPDFVMAVGPIPMMRAVSNITRPHGIYTMVSLNPIMVDGTGMCGSCRVTIAGETVLACVEGPEFDGHKVDFDELMRRNKAYLREEKTAMDGFMSRKDNA